jgi:hypothetical protein
VIDGEKRDGHMNMPEHYRHFPCMTPWVGPRFRSSDHKRLLVIGESHYLPVSSTTHLNSVEWYSASQSVLTHEECEWISTARIVESSKDERFRIRAHGIYKSIAREVNVAGGGHGDFVEAIEDLAFYNYFQRPAAHGASLRVEPLDCEVASAVFRWILSELEPELIVFTSRKAGWACSELLRDLHIPAQNTPHPTCPWWNKASKAYGGRTGRELFRDFLFEQKWHKHSEVTQQ